MAHARHRGIELLGYFRRACVAIWYRLAIAVSLDDELVAIEHRRSLGIEERAHRTGAERGRADAAPATVDRLVERVVHGDTKAVECRFVGTRLEAEDLRAIKIR